MEVSEDVHRIYKALRPTLSSKEDWSTVEWTPIKPAKVHRPANLYLDHPEELLTWKEGE